MTSVLDAWALLAWLQDEDAAERVEATLKAGDAVVSWINLGEVYYMVARGRGCAAAAGAVEIVLDWLRGEEVDSALVLDAARVKARHSLSYADAFAVATAERHAAPLLTGDPEILALERPLVVVDLRHSG